MRIPKMRLLIVIGFLLLFMLGLAACSEPEATPAENVEVTRIVEVPVEVEGPPVEVTRVVEVEVGPDITVPFLEAWQNSPHNDMEAEAFVHWNEDDPAEVPVDCARCHSTPGYIDYVGADGSEFRVVDQAAPIGTTVQCAACHNDVTISMDSVLFPSGVEVVGLGDESRCMVCHQGRASKFTVDDTIVNAGLDPEADLDTVSEDLGFTNIHYYAAAATLYGTVAKGGYEYDGKSYDAKFDHVAGYDSCIDCHNPHTLEVKLDECVTCHQNVTSPEELVNIRMNGSLVDYDGDGDTEEGTYFEIDGMRDMLYQAMQAYAAEVSAVPIVYNEAQYPYFFADANGDGEIGEDEGRYNAWTPRLAKAAYNYQVSLKDPGRFAHGGKYIIELLYDSIEDLNAAIATPVDLSNAHRLDAGHFASSEEAFRHWDEDGAVPGSCSRCHSAAGLPLYIQQNVAIAQPPASGLNCATCHNDLTTFTRFEVEDVTFPSGATLTLDDSDANLCLNCHQGRESTVSMNRLIGELPGGEVSDTLRFLNVHYFAAGATLFGTEAQGAYEYAGQQYAGRFEHVGAKDTCVECHDTHALVVVVEDCAGCHDGVETEEDLTTIRVSEVDFDGDGDVTEGIALEIQTMHEALYAALQAYSTSTEGVAPIVYDNHSHPYFFTDTNGNGTADPEEVNGDNRYATWTPDLLRAAYNYQYVAKDPGAFAHNSMYIMQILYDAIGNVGGDNSAMTRPVIAPAEGG